MAEALKTFTEWIALIVETAAACLVAIGTVEVFVLLTRFGPRATLGDKKVVWVNFAGWLVLALQCELAADVIRTAIAPTWNAIGQLAAIAVVRTFLGYFLDRDMEKAAERRHPAEPSALRRGTAEALPEGGR